MALRTNNGQQTAKPLFILCLCDHGQVRSVAMASVLRERGHFAVAGAYDSYNELLKTGLPKEFIALFDKVVFMQENGRHFIGRDEWGDPTNPDLLLLCVRKAQELNL